MAIQDEAGNAVTDEAGAPLLAENETAVTVVARRSPDGPRTGSRTAANN